MGKLDNFKAVTAAAVISTAATQVPAQEASIISQAKLDTAKLMEQCDTNSDGNIKGIFETTCYTKGEADIIEKENNKLREEIANNREEIANNREEIVTIEAGNSELREEIANNREEIANNREEIMILNKKGQQLAQQALSHLQ